MYEELITELREEAEWAKANEWETPIMLSDHLTQAADAIEELSREIDIDNAAMTEIDAAMPHWIPVSEQLPELDEEVLVCNEDYGLSELGFATVAVWDGTDWIEAWDRRAAICCVTHWMPLPTPPKEEKIS